MTIHAVYPGSFDPFTLGHLDVVTRASTLFDKLTILVVHNPHKVAHTDAGMRAQLVKQVLFDAGIQDREIFIEHLDEGLLVDRCRELDANLILKGVRNSTDLDYETRMATVNRDLTGIETLFLAASPEFSHISSSLVRQVAALNGDVKKYVPSAVADWLAGNIEEKR
jgi:pantetheine-phosphate adenylyltransferase